MRRWLQHILPIVLLTVLAQILAPVGSIWAAAAADPLGAIPICSQVGQHGDGSADAGPSSHSPCCPLCAVAEGVALPEAATGLLLERLSYALAWTITAGAPRGIDFDGRARARAPPRVA